MENVVDGWTGAHNVEADISYFRELRCRSGFTPRWFAEIAAIKPLPQFDSCHRLLSELVPRQYLHKAANKRGI